MIESPSMRIQAKSECHNREITESVNLYKDKTYVDFRSTTMKICLSLVNRQSTHL